MSIFNRIINLIDYSFSLFYLTNGPYLIIMSIIRTINIDVMTFLIVMNKLKKISLIFSFVTLTIAVLALVTLNAIYMIGGVASFVMAIFYLYLNRARQSFKRDLLDTLK